MERRPLLGDEAVALGAIHSGLSGAYSYPGTPATEIFEFVSRETRKEPPAAQGGVQHQWSANEKVAYEEALGMSYAGRRALVSFKHVGLNVAADPFMNSGVSGITGGLVVASADDPGMHSSQDEQDSRVYANFALIPCYEPATGQEGYDMTREAYDMSEKYSLPIMMRLVTRFSHARSPIGVGTRREPNPLAPAKDPKSWTLLPSNARVQYAKLAAKQSDLLKWSESSPWNVLKLNSKGGRMGVIAAGVAYNYFRENYPDDATTPSFLKIGLYPIPAKLVRALLETVDTVLVLEDGYPVIEGALRGMFDSPLGKKVLGKLDGTLPRTGELTPDIVRTALGLQAWERQQKTDTALPVRPPRLCDGCPHIDTYNMLRVLLGEYPDARVFGDIGCYTLGAYPPYNAVHSTIAMGASISMAMGAAQAGMKHVMASIGDGTFLHSGMTPLIGAAKQNLNMTVFILDNGTTAMTGGQESMVNDEKLINVVKGLGVNPEHIKVIEPLRKHHEANLAIIRNELAYEGLSVIIPTRECVVTARK